MPVGTVRDMKIPSLENHNYWRTIAAHAGTKSNSAPWPVQLQVAALVGDREIVGSTSEYSAAGPTVWCVIAVTDDARLVKVVVEFQAEDYDLEAERSYQEKAPEHRVIEASVRRLKDIVGLEIGPVEQRRGSFRQVLLDQLDVGDVRLGFVGADDFELGINQLDMPYHEDRSRTDQLIAVIRAQAGL